jgi:hypothetical protein
MFLILRLLTFYPINIYFPVIFTRIVILTVIFAKIDKITIKIVLSGF